MTENLAGRGEGLAGLVARIGVWRRNSAQYQTHYRDADGAHHYHRGAKEAFARVEGELAALEAAAPPSTAQQLTFAEFARINRQRCESKDGFNHALSSWSTSDWFTAVLGELGEAANIAKKLNRVRDGIPGNKVSKEELAAKLRQELGDVFVYLDLLAQSLGVSIGEAATEVFNAKSQELGCPIALATPSPQAPPEQCNAFSPTSARAVREAARKAIEAWMDLDAGQFHEEGKLFKRVDDAIVELFAEPAGSEASELKKGDEVLVRGKVKLLFADGVVAVSFERLDPMNNQVAYVESSTVSAGSPRKVGEDGAQPVAFVIETEGGDLYDRGDVIFGDARQARDRADDLNSELEKESFRVAPLYRALSLSSLPESSQAGPTEPQRGEIYQLGFKALAVMIRCEYPDFDENHVSESLARIAARATPQASSEIREALERAATVRYTVKQYVYSQGNDPSGNNQNQKAELREIEKTLPRGAQDAIRALAPSRQGAGGK